MVANGLYLTQLGLASFPGEELLKGFGEGEEGLEVGLFRDGGTMHFSDDEFVQTAILF